MLAVALALGALAACGGPDGADGDDQADAAGGTTPSAAPTTAPAGDPGGAPATGAASPTPSATYAPPPTAPPPRAWDGDVDFDLDSGEVTADGFNSVVDGDQPAWARSARATARALLHLADDDVAALSSQDTADGAVVTVTRTDLADDSTEAWRYEFTLARGNDGLFRFGSGQVEWRCRPDRGSQEFSTDPCL